MLATVEFEEQAVGSPNEVVVVGQIVGSQGYAAYEFGHEFRPILIRKRVEFVEQLLGSLGHEIRFAFSVLRVKFVAESEANASASAAALMIVATPTAPARTVRPSDQFNSYGTLQTKLAASSMLPVPLYLATCG